LTHPFTWDEWVEREADERDGYNYSQFSGICLPNMSNWRAENFLPADYLAKSHEDVCTLPREEQGDVYDMARRLSGSDSPGNCSASVWMSVGLDTTVSLFPAIHTVAPRITIPLAVANATVGGFKKLYEDNLSRTGAVIRGEYSTIQDRLEQEMGHSADFLPATPFGRAAMEVLVSVLDHRRAQTADKEMARAHAMAMIKHPEYGILEVSKQAIRARTRAGLQPTFDKIDAVYRGSHFTPGGVLWRIDLSRETCHSNHLGIRQDRYHPIRGEYLSCGPRHRFVSGGRMSPPKSRARQNQQVAMILSNIWALQVHADYGYFRKNRTYTWPSTEKPAILELAKSYERSLPNDFKTNLERADRAQWQDTLRRTGYA